MCSDCVWPCVAAIASRQVRVALLKMSCAVSDQPDVCECVRSDSERSSFGLNSSLMSFAQIRRAGAHLGDLHEVVHADRPEERQARRKRVDVETGATPARTYSMPSAIV